MRCWYTRWQMSNALDRGDLASRVGRGHAAGCAACQAFGNALASLDARLFAGAAAAAVPVPAARRTRWPLLLAGPALAAAAAIAIVVGTSDPVAPVVVAPPSVATVAPLAQVRHVADRVAQVLAHTPLETELADLIQDGRRGLDAVLATGGLDRSP